MNVLVLYLLKCIFLVCNVLPVVLSAPPAELPQKQALRWLQKGIEFYISYITCPPGKEMASSPNAGQYQILLKFWKVILVYEKNNGKAYYCSFHIGFTQT